MRFIFGLRSQGTGGTSGFFDNLNHGPSSTWAGGGSIILSHSLMRFTAREQDSAFKPDRQSSLTAIQLASPSGALEKVPDREDQEADPVDQPSQNRAQG